MRPPWTHEELRAMLRVMEDRVKQYEANSPNARPLPPLSEEECRRYIYSLMDRAAERPLNLEECFLFGQILAQYRMAIEARMLLGGDGRYYVISEADMERAATRR